jgi:hypothetical protein
LHAEEQEDGVRLGHPPQDAPEPLQVEVPIPGVIAHVEWRISQDEIDGPDRDAFCLFKEVPGHKADLGLIARWAEMVLDQRSIFKTGAAGAKLVNQLGSLFSSDLMIRGPKRPPDFPPPKLSPEYLRDGPAKPPNRTTFDEPTAEARTSHGDPKLGAGGAPTFQR